MRRRWTATGLAAAAAVVLLTAPAATADPADAPGPSTDQLATTHVVVDPTAPALPTGLGASAWLVADADTGAVLAAKNARARYLPASTLKVLTALTLVPRIPADRMITAQAPDVNVDGTKVGLVPGKAYPASLLFTAMLIASGNDAATVLAAANGSVSRTVAEMNAEAVRLGALDTHAGTPSGLDAHGEHTTAYDLAVLGRAALHNPDIAAYVRKPTAEISAPGTPTFQIANHNPLLGRYSGTIGLKPGYTVAAGATYIGAAQRGGRTIIVTLLHAEPHFTQSAERLLTWGFAADGKVVPVGRLATPKVAENVPVMAALTAAPTAVAPARHEASLLGGLLTGGLQVAGALVVAVVLLRVRAVRRQRRRRELRQRERTRQLQRL